MKKRYYIAYGSNLNITQMKLRCPSATIVGVSEIENYELLFKGSFSGSYLTIEPKQGSKVPVAIWRVSESDEESLDRYEGFPSFYYKTEMELPIRLIKSKEVRKERCFVYIMHEYRSVGVPTGSYVAVCLEGYRSFNFDETYLFKARKKSLRASF